MSVLKVNEVIASSPENFEAAARQVATRANDTLRGVEGIEVLEKWVVLTPDTTREYFVRVRLVFEMAPETVFHM